MYWGQLIDSASRVERTCFLSTCGTTIPARERHMGLVSRNRSGQRFTRHLCIPCFIPYILSAREHRQELIAANRVAGPGRTPMGLSPEAMKRRQALIQRISAARRQFVLALVQRKPHRIRTAREQLASKLELMASGTYGPEYKFTWGDDLVGLLRDGADPTLLAADLDSASTLTEIVELLRDQPRPISPPMPTSEAVEDLIGLPTPKTTHVNSDTVLLSAKQGLLISLRLSRHVPRALRAVAAALQTYEDHQPTPSVRGLSEALADYLTPEDLTAVADAGESNWAMANALVAAALRAELSS